MFDPSESDIEVESDELLEVDLAALLEANPVELDGQFLVYFYTPMSH